MPESVDVPTDEVVRTCAANHTCMTARTLTQAETRALPDCADDGPPHTPFSAVRRLSSAVGSNNSTEVATF